MRHNKLFYRYLYGCLGGFFLALCLLLPKELAAVTGEALYVKFDFLMEDTKGNVVYSETGELLVRGGKYRVEITDEMLIVCDGKAQWLYSPINDDITVSYSDVSPHLSKVATPDGIIKTIITLFSLEEGDKSNLEIKKDKEGNLSEVVLRSYKTLYRIKIKSLSTVTDIPEDKFVFKVELYPGAVITDLR